MNNIRKCPNCIQSASEAYQQGYADAMRLHQEEILKASQSRPIQFVLPENFVQQPLCGSGGVPPTPKLPETASYSGTRRIKKRSHEMNQ